MYATVVSIKEIKSPSGEHQEKAFKDCLESGLWRGRDVLEITSRNAFGRY